MKCSHFADGNTLLELLLLIFIGKAIVQLVGCVLLIFETKRWKRHFIFTEPNCADDILFTRKLLCKFAVRACVFFYLQTAF